MIHLNVIKYWSTVSNLFLGIQGITCTTPSTLITWIVNWKCHFSVNLFFIFNKTCFLKFLINNSVLWNSTVSTKNQWKDCFFRAHTPQSSLINCHKSVQINWLWLTWTGIASFNTGRKQRNFRSTMRSCKIVGTGLILWFSTEAAPQGKTPVFSLL